MITISSHPTPAIGPLPMREYLLNLLASQLDDGSERLDKKKFKRICGSDTLTSRRLPPSTKE